MSVIAEQADQTRPSARTHSPGNSLNQGLGARLGSQRFNSRAFHALPMAGHSAISYLMSDRKCVFVCACMSAC